MSDSKAGRVRCWRNNRLRVADGTRHEPMKKPTDREAEDRTVAEIRFEQYRESLLRELKTLALYSRIYHQLFKRKADRLVEMNMAPAFFAATAVALHSVIIILVLKLFDKNEERGIVNFLTIVASDRQLFDVKRMHRRRSRNLPHDNWPVAEQKAVTPETIEGHRQKIAELKPLPNFELWRDKYLAHFDKKFFFNPNQLQELAPLDWPDLEQVLELGKEIFNTYSAAYDGIKDAIEPTNASDVDYLLDRLHQYLANEWIE
jgi:hypothetical protein